ncbi:MAG: response regulator [Rubrivivax sp.]|jgi:CheY-like chemotaxis protein|nr:response regulator [Rubrivivax sp.]
MRMAEPLRSVLLVEDDASITRFVAMALEEDPVRLTTAPTLRAARALLQRHRYDVLLCDLMLTDGSGLDLLRELGTQAGLRRVAFSASLHGPQRAELARLGVDEVLSKPVAMDDLRRALLQPPAPGSAPPAPATPTPAADPVQAYFGGDHTLHAAYREQCHAQFAADLASGDASAAAGRWAELRRLAHSLKSVLRMLGDARGSERARELEDLSAKDEAAAATAAWQALRPHLQPGGGAPGHHRAP